MNIIAGIDPAIAALLEKSPREELDYGLVMDCLKGYASPRKKLNHLLKIKALVRVKKGIYIFGKSFARHPYSPEVLANLIYGPSYISLEWACQFYRLIPEKVTTVTSVTHQRSRQFRTPVGLFTYDHLAKKSFSLGVVLTQFSDHQSALIATREKAVVDLLVLRRGACRSLKHLKEILFEDLRMDEEDLKQFDLAAVKAIHQARPHSAVRYLLNYLESK